MTTIFRAVLLTFLFGGVAQAEDWCPYTGETQQICLGNPTSIYDDDKDADGPEKIDRFSGGISLKLKQANPGERVKPTISFDGLFQSQRLRLKGTFIFKPRKGEDDFGVQANIEFFW